MRRSEIEYRPIDSWRGELTVARKSAPFKADSDDTMRLLCFELDMVRAEAVALLVALNENEFRRDGMPRQDVKPRHPGVILVCTMKHGPFRMQCDTFDRFYHNVRAIALSLEALRKMERYGCVARGEQYRGWTAIAAGDDREFPTVEAAVRFLRTLLGVPDSHQQAATELIRRATFKAHPDHGGTETMMKQVLKAKAKIEGAS